MSLNDIWQQWNQRVLAGIHSAKETSDWQSIKGSIIYEFVSLFSSKPDSHIEQFETHQICERNNILNMDFNFTSTLRLAGELSQNKPI